MWGLYKMGFVQEQQKLNKGSWETIHPGTIDRGFNVTICSDVFQCLTEFSYLEMTATNPRVRARFVKFTVMLQR
jgi:hypothetical protein